MSGDNRQNFDIQADGSTADGTNDRDCKVYPDNRGNLND
jgi:hypothetical protein